MWVVPTARHGDTEPVAWDPVERHLMVLPHDSLAALLKSKMRNNLFLLLCHLTLDINCMTVLETHCFTLEKWVLSLRKISINLSV